MQLLPLEVNKFFLTVMTFGDLLSMNLLPSHGLCGFHNSLRLHLLIEPLSRISIHYSSSLLLVTFCYVYSLDDDTIYHQTSSHSPVTSTFQGKRNKTILWPGLWSQIDAVTIIDRKLLFSKDFNVIYNYNDMHEDVNSTFIDSYAEYYLFHQSDWNQERIFRFCETDTSSYHQLGPMFGINSLRGFKPQFSKHRNPGDIDEKTGMDEVQRLKEESLIQTTTRVGSTRSNLTETDSTSSSVKSNPRTTFLASLQLSSQYFFSLQSLFYTSLWEEKGKKKMREKRKKKCEKKERKRNKVKPVRSKKVVQG